MILLCSTGFYALYIEREGIDGKNIFSPFLSSLKPDAVRIHASDFPGGDPSSPIEVATMQHEVRGNYPHTPCCAAAASYPVRVWPVVRPGWSSNTG